MVHNCLGQSKRDYFSGALTQVHFRLGQNERIFFEKDKQTHYLDKWVAEGTLTAVQFRQTTPGVTKLGRFSLGSSSVMALASDEGE
jgi:hypothetical protein